MNQYPTWKNLLVLMCIVIGIGFALPNFYGEDPALMIAKENGLTFSQEEIKEIGKFLSDDGSEYKTIEDKDGDVLIRFDNVENQIKASDKVRSFLGRFSTVALAFAPNVPGFLDAMDMKPMSLGLDLRGGVYFQFQVDLDTAVQQRLDQYVTDINKELIDQRIRRTIRKEGNSIRIELVNPDDFNATRRIVRELDNLLAFENVSTQSQTAVLVTMTDDQLKQRRDFAIQQNILTMRNRVNELGVAEPIIQRQGLDRIVVQLPGVQDPTQAERILGATATLEFRLVCENENAFEAEEKGRAPIGCELFNDRSENPVLLKKKAIVTGNQLIDASQSFSQGRPAVSIRLDSKGSKAMLETTKKNLNKPMAVLFVQQRQETSEQDGNFVNRTVLDKEVINIATIRGVFSSQFEITGLTVFEAKDLAILLRAGALAAPIFKIEEKTVGPSLGQDNIEKGFTAILYGLIAVIVFMIIWYKGFGLIANIGLLINLTFIVAVLSMLQASLTLPGIAGIVLTVGMAVDANVLIFERIREEINNGNSPQASISAGYQKAFATITDANVTTLIASLVLFTFGTGPIKGFAITLSIGILTSLFTAIIVSRALVNLIYGGKTIEKLRI
ncbi:MAG TPA: protein translocase subunit SecD [Gammaproteobacteria bacterium]|jgi:preprotein translocase subunit SecD|nr:protein translocase subunit SecD [Gammaproteobacteria bacterium]MBQ08750.1 protein translocase subunit SecD [Gammaproteobacteria bacterium]HJM08571.1 protein translocase subunit SecD [Gammaproteobacteria bacterium]HJN00384.1 protein translocase subunit SecD [Gammaproteobacteria bacterium]|tara:strand:+ start:32205 stop:34049 length:1845 start_codon:yes stop_codon:yes gene_type:complete